MIPTAEEFLKINFEGGAINPIILIEFAQLHVEAALKAANNQNNHPDAFFESNTWWIPADSILNAYPKELII